MKIKLSETMNKKIIQITSANDIERAFPIMKELRPHLSFAEYNEIFEQASKSDDYQIVGIELNGDLVALMGFRFLTDFVRGKHIYIDDLVATEKMRSKGLGADLLSYAENLAVTSNCKSLRLCTGIENESGIRFYDRLGWKKRAYAYTKKLQNSIVWRILCSSLEQCQKKCSQNSKKSGAQRIRLHVFQKNEVALKLYESMGFQTSSIDMYKLV